MRCRAFAPALLCACAGSGAFTDIPMPDDTDVTVETEDSDVADTDDTDLPPAELPFALTIADPTLFPESIAYDTKRQRFVSGSLRDGRVYAIGLDGTVTPLYTPTPGLDDAWTTRGIKLDADDQLWACALLGREAHVWVLDAKTGELLHDVSLAGLASQASCNDLAVLPDRVLVTDERNPNVYAIDRGTFAASIWLTDPMLEGGLVGANGIVWADPWVIVGRYSQKVAVAMRADERRPHEVALLGTVPPLGGGAGWDGLLWDGTHLWVAGVGEVLRFTPDDADWTSATGEGVATTDDGWTSLTRADGAVYALSSDPIAFVLGTDPDLPFSIVRVGP
jgi:hypothetical protein